MLAFSGLMSAVIAAGTWWQDRRSPTPPPEPSPVTSCDEATMMIAALDAELREARGMDPTGELERALRESRRGQRALAGVSCWR